LDTDTEDTDTEDTDTEDTDTEDTDTEDTQEQNNLDITPSQDTVDTTPSLLPGLGEIAEKTNVSFFIQFTKTQLIAFQKFNISTCILASHALKLLLQKLYKLLCFCIRLVDLIFCILTQRYALSSVKTNLGTRWDQSVGTKKSRDQVKSVLNNFSLFCNFFTKAKLFKPTPTNLLFTVCNN
jgi:hypothetical protein